MFTEVEKFISSNTQELGKDKWLCPLSGKKFKGPEFVRKHIVSKHNEKIEEVKTEVRTIARIVVALDFPPHIPLRKLLKLKMLEEIYRYNLGLIINIHGRA